MRSGLLAPLTWNRRAFIAALLAGEQCAGLDTEPGIALAALTGLGASDAQGRRRRPRAPGDPLPDGVPDDLVEAIAMRQDREAFKRLFAAFAPRVKAFARRRGAEPQVVEDPSLQVDGEPPADERLAERRRQGDLRQAVARLPEAQSHLLRLAYFEDKSHGVIAEELDLPLGTVKSRIRLAMRKLRQMLKEDD